MQKTLISKLITFSSLGRLGFLFIKAKDGRFFISRWGPSRFILVGVNISQIYFFQNVINDAAVSSINEVAPLRYETIKPHLKSRDGRIG